jgi:galactose-1-phosphate uridylyltransferase
LEDNFNSYDIKIKKPFLPQKLIKILNNFNDIEDEFQLKEEIDNSLMETFLKMPSQKIRNILKGAEVTIKINFPKEAK